MFEKAIIDEDNFLRETPVYIFMLHNFPTYVKAAEPNNKKIAQNRIKLIYKHCLETIKITETKPSLRPFLCYLATHQFDEGNWFD